MVNLDKVKALIREKGIKYKYICSQLGVAESYFGDVKQGKTTISRERLHQIADLLETTPEYLTDKSDIATKPTIDKKNELPQAYLNLAKSAHARNIDPKDVELIFATIENMRNKEKAKDKKE